MQRKSFLIAGLCGAVVAAVGADSALAGEVNGKLQPIPATTVAQSICSFSGHNDNPASTDPEDPGGVAQSYGFSWVRNGLKAVVPAPGEACNGHTGFFAGGGGEE